SLPEGIAIDDAGNPLITDLGSDVVRVIAQSTTNPGYPLTGCSGTCAWTVGNIYTIAGTGNAGYNGDGVASTTGQLNEPEGPAVDPEGNVLLGDTSNHRVRLIAVSTTNPGYSLSGCAGTCSWTPGDIYTIAGDGTASFNVDGVPASQGRVVHPIAL